MLKKIIFVLLIIFLFISISNIIFATDASNSIFTNNVSFKDTSNFSEISNTNSSIQENSNYSYTTSTTDYDDPFELSITNMINIILIAVGIVLIFLGIAIIFKK